MRALHGTALAVMMLLVLASCGREKVGVLMINAGTPETYEPSWMVPFFTNIFDFFPPGFFAGGGLEGETCYTMIHYANEGEAEICGVAPGTKIDIFCHEYTGSYPVHSIDNHTNNDYEQNCFSPALFPLTIAEGDITYDPDNGSMIIGPHIDDPAGPGVGIADFLEVTGFASMEAMLRRPGKKTAFREQMLRWLYGNDAPGYDPVEPEPINIKDMLTAALPRAALVFRHGWEVALENRNIYGNPANVQGSLENVISELIDVEKVDRIVVLHSTSYHSNSTHFGHEWFDRKGKPVSRIPGKTFKECVEDVDDEYGPKDEISLQEFLNTKPWDKHADHPFAFIKRIVESKKPGFPVVFADQSGNYPEASQAAAELVQYAIEKHSIPDTASLKVITAHHGFAKGHMDSQDCDYYFTSSEEFMAKTVAAIKKKLAWKGTLDVVSRPLEFAEGTTYDFPSQASPFGSIISAAEEIDQSINGTYVNVLGEVVDNGKDKFAYIIVMPNNHAESEDTLYGFREEMLGNNIPKGSEYYVRGETDADGTAYDAEDVDDDFFTVKAFDGTGWPSKPGCRLNPTGCNLAAPVFKGSTDKPTTVILCGSFLGNKNSAGREQLTKAMVKSLVAAIWRPIFGNK